MSAISGGVVPDLRHSSALGSDSWYAIVQDGLLADNGMASFRDVLSRDRITGIRAYVISEAQKAKAGEGHVKPARIPAQTGVGL